MLGRAVALVLAFVVGDLVRVRRMHVEAAMTRAGVHNPRRMARAMYRDLARGLVELIAMALRPGARAFARVALPTKTLSAIQGARFGAVIATAHTGNWDLCACAVARRTPLSVVTKRLSVRLFDSLWQGVRREQSVKLLEVDSAARAALAALRKGELVAMLIDQAPERSRAVVTTPFLGAVARVDLAPALVAMRARAPLIVAFPRRDAEGSHAIEVAGVLSPPAKPNRAWPKSAMIEATRLLEDFVVRHPEQWLWMHRRWKAVPDATRAIRGVRRLAGESP